MFYLINVSSHGLHWGLDCGYLQNRKRWWSSEEKHYVSGHKVIECFSLFNPLFILVAACWDGSKGSILLEIVEWTQPLPRILAFSLEWHTLSNKLRSKENVSFSVCLSLWSLILLLIARQFHPEGIKSGWGRDRGLNAFLGTYIIHCVSSLTVTLSGWPWKETTCRCRKASYCSLEKFGHVPHGRKHYLITWDGYVTQFLWVTSDELLTDNGYCEEESSSFKGTVTGRLTTF